MFLLFVPYCNKATFRFVEYTFLAMTNVESLITESYITNPWKVGKF